LAAPAEAGGGGGAGRSAFGRSSGGRSTAADGFQGEAGAGRPAGSDRGARGGEAAPVRAHGAAELLRVARGRDRRRQDSARGDRGGAAGGLFAVGRAGDAGDGW